MHEQSFEIAALHAAYAAGAEPRAVMAEAALRIARAADPGIFLHLEPAERVAAEVAALGPFDPVARPLWGIPFAIKDNIDAAGAPTTAACPAFAYVAEADAPAVAALRAAGAVLIGKTNLDQFATGLVGVRTPHPVPRNAVDPSRIPGGSSSGSAVATARGLTSFALGTDTAGSGRIPAGLNGIVGLKPSLGLISTRGVVPACRSLDCVSILAGSVADAFAVLRVCAGFDAADPYALPQPAPALVAFDAPRLLAPDRASRRFFGDAAAEAAFDLALEDLAALGAHIEEVDFAPLFEVAALLYEGAWVAERHAAIADFLARAPEALHPVTAGIIRGAERLSAADAFRGLYRLQALRREAAALIATGDALVTPTVPRFCTLAEVAAAPIEANSRLGTYANFVNLLGLCGLSVPTRARPDGLPGGVTLLAPAGRDGALATLGEALHLRAGPAIGATGHAPVGRLGPAAAPAPGRLLAVVGAHMRGMPLNADLVARGARFVRAARTAPVYRLFDLADARPRKPGLLRAASGGAAIELELWRLPDAALGAMLAELPSPMTFGPVALEDGGAATGFLVEEAATRGAAEITRHGGWRAALAAG